MGIIDSLFGPKMGPRDYNCARVYRGQYLADTNELVRSITVDFQILHGDTVIKLGRSVRVYEPDPDTFAKLETFYIFPRSQYVRLLIKNGCGSRSIFLFYEGDRRKSRMFKQRL